jgi:hypothetical protein
VGSFRLQLAAEGKAERTLRNYAEAVRWFAAAYLLAETDKPRWEQVDRQDLRQWAVRLLGDYSTAPPRSSQVWLKWCRNRSSTRRPVLAL